MTSIVKRGLLAIGLSVGLLLLPFAMMAWVITLGGADPLLGMMAAFAAGTMIAFVGLIASAFAWRGGRWRGLVVFFVVVVAVDLAWLPVGWAWDLKSRPYERADVAFAQLEEPAVDLSGTWEGKWVDPRRSYSEGIVLKLNQADGRVSGSITTETGMTFEVIDGVVSGHRLNIHYDVGFPAWSRRVGVGSLIGAVSGDRLTGTWYAHERPKHGGAREGPWQASRISLEDIGVAPSEPPP